MSLVNLNNFNIFSKEFWDFKDELTKEYINVFEGTSNINSKKDCFEKMRDIVPGLVFNDPNIWSFTINIIVKSETRFTFYNKTKNFTRYKLKGTRISDTSWDLKVKGRGNIDFSINSDQKIMYSSQDDFIMKYTIETF